MPLKTHSVAVCVLLRRPDYISPKIREHRRIRKSLLCKASKMTFSEIYKEVITLHVPGQFRKGFVLIPGAAGYFDSLSTAVANGSSVTSLDDI
jgi:hypothetical protein